MEQASTVSAAFIFPARSSVVHTMSWRTDDWRVMKKRTTVLTFNIFSFEYKFDKILKLSVLFIFQLICSLNIHHQIAQPQLHLIHASHHSTISWICVMILKIRHNIVLSIKFSHTMHWKHVFIICFCFSDKIFQVWILKTTGVPLRANYKPDIGTDHNIGDWVRGEEWDSDTATVSGWSQS